MKGNSDRCNFITSTKNLIGNSSIGNCSCKKLLKVKVDSKPTFDDHVILKIYARMLTKTTRISQSNIIYENWKENIQRKFKVLWKIFKEAFS